MTAALGTATAAQAAPTAAAGLAIQPYATGFPSLTRGAWTVGPLGVAFDHADRLYVADAIEGNIYRFSGPGAAGPATRLGTSTLGARPAGLAIDATDHLYVARTSGSDVLELDRGDGHVIRRLASGFCALGIAADPVSGDLFVARCDGPGGVIRIADVGSANPRVERFAPGLENPDGVTVAPDGTLYVATGNGLYRVQGLGSATPGTSNRIATIPNADGVAVSASTTNGTPDFALVNRTDGIVTKVDLLASEPTPTDIVTGGARGDFLAVNLDGCVYLTQGDAIQRLSKADGKCAAPTSGGPESGPLGGGLAPTTPPAPTTPAGQGGIVDLPPNKKCVDRRKFKFRLHHAPGQRVVAVTAFVNGKRTLRQTGHDISELKLPTLPKGRFRVRIVATQSSGSMLISTRIYRGCRKGKPHTRHGGRK
jgi:sugar lactone lactonase YvrE